MADTRNNRLQSHRPAGDVRSRRQNWHAAKDHARAAYSLSASPLLLSSGRCFASTSYTAKVFGGACTALAMTNLWYYAKLAERLAVLRPTPLPERLEHAVGASIGASTQCSPRMITASALGSSLYLS